MKLKKRTICLLTLLLILTLSFTSFSSNGFLFDDSDRRILTEKDVESLPIHAVRLAINEIFARHGRMYETEDLATYFSSQSWYNPQYKASEFNEEKLFNSVETANVKFLSEWKDNLEKDLVLQEMNAKYSPTAYILPDSDKKYLLDSDVALLTKEELRYGLNEIYARHGRIYESEDLNSYFKVKTWYTPSLTAGEFSEDNLFNVYEKENIKFISRVREDSELQSIVNQTITIDNVSVYTDNLTKSNAGGNKVSENKKPSASANSDKTA